MRQLYVLSLTISLFQFHFTDNPRVTRPVPDEIRDVGLGTDEPDACMWILYDVVASTEGDVGHFRLLREEQRCKPWPFKIRKITTLTDKPFLANHVGPDMVIALFVVNEMRRVDFNPAKKVSNFHIILSIGISFQ